MTVGTYRRELEQQQGVRLVSELREAEAARDSALTAALNARQALPACGAA
jgi:hypothetical protein